MGDNQRQVVVEGDNQRQVVVEGDNQLLLWGITSLRLLRRITSTRLLLLGRIASIRMLLWGIASTTHQDVEGDNQCQVVDGHPPQYQHPGNVGRVVEQLDG